MTDLPIRIHVSNETAQTGNGPFPIDTSTHRGWLRHVLAWCQGRKERHALLIGYQRPAGIEVAPGLYAVASPDQPTKGMLHGEIVAAVPLDRLAEWLEKP